MTLFILPIAAVIAAPFLVACLIWVAHYRFWRWRLQRDHEYGHTERITLPDGGTMELRRVGAHLDAGSPDATPRAPVLLIHGLAMSHRNQDAAKEYSFARYLHETGRDVWLVTLRSGCTRWSLFGPRHCTFASMARHDVPLAVEAVLAHTRATQLDLVGFSMGGMLIYACLGRSLDPARVRRVAVFGSPAAVPRMLPFSYWGLVPAALTPTVPVKLWTRSFAWSPRWLTRILWRRAYNPDNVGREVERHMLWNVWEDVPGQLLADFLRWSMRGGEFTLNGERAVDGLSRVGVPVCFFAGARDWLAPSDSVRTAFEAWGRALPQPEKHFVVLGRAHGTRHDYGHCDLAFGLHAREEVFEPAACFLESGKAPAPSVPSAP